MENLMDSDDENKISLWQILREFSALLSGNMSQTQKPITQRGHFYCRELDLSRFFHYISLFKRLYHIKYRLSLFEVQSLTLMRHTFFVTHQIIVQRAYLQKTYDASFCLRANFTGMLFNNSPLRENQI
jgi:hypothetical protein